LGRIPDATIQEIRSRADIVGLIGRHVELKQAGRSWKGLCPFHDEKSPSFHVTPEREIFHCFGCNKGGDVITFVCEYENLTFPEAVRALAQELGIDVPETGDRRHDEGPDLFGALDVAQRFFRDQLSVDAGKGAREYLEKRGLAAEVIDRFGLGFAPDEWDGASRALRAAGIDDRTAAAAGLVSERKSGGYYDRLRGRVTFPIMDIRGRVIAFGGRALGADQEPKYLNTPETAVYHKREAFYGFPHALEPIRKSERAVVCEGYFDAIALDRAGVREALATCGTALSSAHAKQLRRRTQNVSLLFDGDSAGRRAMESALAELLPVDVRVRAVTLPAGEDPHDYLESHGDEALRSLIDRAPNAIEVVMRSAMAAGCATPSEKSDVVARVAPLVALVPNPVERSEYARRLSVATGTDPQAVEAVVRESRGGGGRAAAEKLSADLVRPRATSEEKRHIRQMALILSRHPGLASASVCEQIHEVVPGGEWKALIFQLVDAGEDGCVDQNGAIDALALESQLGDESAALLRSVIVDESLLDSETSPAVVLADLLRRFSREHRRASESELTRRMQDPSEDEEELLKKKQAQLERKRHAAGIGPGRST
jgi:DNA primase